MLGCQASCDSCMACVSCQGCQSCQGTCNNCQDCVFCQAFCENEQSVSAYLGDFSFNECLDRGEMILSASSWNRLMKYIKDAYKLGTKKDGGNPRFTRKCWTKARI